MPAERITAAELGVVDDLARRILVRARGIAPCIDNLETESEERKDAIAILKGVAARASAIGTGAVSSQGRNGTSISFREIKSAFTLEDISELQSLCSIVSTPPALPQGSFPKARPLANMWPEGEYS